MYISNIYKDSELSDDATNKKFLLVQKALIHNRVNNEKPYVGMTSCILSACDFLKYSGVILSAESICPFKNL